MASIQNTANVSAASLEILSKLVNLNLQRQVVMAGKVLDLSAEAVQGSKSIKIMKFGDLSVGTKADGSAVTFGTSTLSTDDLALDQYKYVAFEFERYAKLQGPALFFEELAKNAAIKLGQNFDAAIATALKAGAATGALSGGISQASVIKLRSTLNAAEVAPENRYLGIHPDDYATILGIASFVDAEKYGSSNIASGVVGTLYGMQVIENTAFTAGQLVAWQQSCMASAMQMAPTIETQFDIDNLSDKWVLSTVYGTKMLKAAKAIKLV
jgi:hypothetical protein